MTISVKDVMEFIIPISRFNRGEANKIFAEVHKTGVKVVLKNNVRVGVLVDPEQYDEMVEMLEDYALYLEAEAREKKSSESEIVSESQVLKNLGISESELDDVDVEIDE